MKKHLLLLLIFNFQFSIFNSALAQYDYSTQNPAAGRAFGQALRFYDARQNGQALAALATALEKDSMFVEALSMQGNIFEDMKDYPRAMDSYRRAIRSNPDFFLNNYFALASCEFKTEAYDSARVHFMKFISFPKINAALLAKANKYIANCDFAIVAIQHPVPFKPQNMGDSINTADQEYFPCITADGKTFLFTRRKKITDSFGKKTEEEDFYSSRLVKKTWSHALPLAELNTEGNEGAPCLSADGQYLFFIGCEESYGYPEGREKGEGSCDVYIAKKTGEKFAAPRNLHKPVNTSAWESQPSFSSDGRTLYFIRSVKTAEGKSQRDIFVTFIDDSAHWSEPVPLPDNINTSGDEMTVFIHPDNQTLYFSSDGHPGMGGLDIFMCKRKDDGSWGDPVNLGYPINTSADDNSLLVSPDGKVAYFASNRGDSHGGLDLYQFDLYEGAQPAKVTYMKGKVFDAETKLPLAASFELIDLQTAKPVVRSSSNAGNGEFLVCIPAGKSYALNVSRDGYLFYSDNFMLKDIKSATEPFLKDVPLKPLKVGESVVLKNIFYETDKYELKDESRAELGKIIAFMNKNPNVKVEISGHTDNTGTKFHNKTLSEYRAKSVYDFLSSEGIKKERMSYVGCADESPVATNKTEAGKAQNRRTEFTIVSVN